MNSQHYFQMCKIRTALTSLHFINDILVVLQLLKIVLGCSDWNGKALGKKLNAFAILKKTRLLILLATIL